MKTDTPPPATPETSPYQAMIDALSAHVALLDARGKILAVNRAWQRFASANGARTSSDVGINYLTLLDRIENCPACGDCCTDDLQMAHQVGQGIRRVLGGETDRFQLEYPCDGPSESRWFLLTVTRFPGEGPVSAVVAHEDISNIIAAEAHALEQSSQLAAAFEGAVNAIALAVEKRDPYTAGHQNQVSRLCLAIGQILGLDESRLYGLRLGAVIHDIGKISVPAEILSKPGRLSEPELQIIRTHPETGYEILQGIAFPWPLARMVREHHEKIDGSGYPRGLRGDDICLEARIIAVADVFDAITSHRPYRPARSPEEALQVLEAGRAERFDARVIDALLIHLSTATPS